MLRKTDLWKLSHKGTEISIGTDNGLYYREVRGGRVEKVGYGTIYDLLST